MKFSYSLVKGKNPLFKSREDILTSGFVVSKQYTYRDKYGLERKSFKFAEAGSSLNFFNYWYQLPNQEKHFFEHIFAHQDRKFYLDIDLDQVKINEFPPKLRGFGLKFITDRLMDDLIKTLNSLWSTMFSRPFNPHQDIIIFESHTQQKSSFHVVFPTTFCSRSICVAMFDYILDNIDTFFKHCYDKGVYSSSQNFRMVFNSKLGKNNIKLPCHNWSYGGIQGSYTVNLPNLPASIDKQRFISLQIFQESLLTIPSSTREIPTIPEKYLAKPKRTSQKQASPNCRSPFFSLPYVEDNQIPEGFCLGDEDTTEPHGYTLIRTSPSYCKVCDRIHDSQNAKLVYNRESQQWFFFCYRASQEDKEVRMIPITLNALDEFDEFYEYEQ